MHCTGMTHFMFLCIQTIIMYKSVGAEIVEAGLCWYRNTGCEFD